MEDSGDSEKRRPFRVLKYATVAVASGTLLLVAAAAYLVATFDPNDYRDQIVRLVKEKTGRSLHIGEIALSFWPPVGLRIESVSLTERDSEETFASVERARVQVELLPLVSREVVASQLVLVGARIHITRYEDGRLNIDDLFGGQGPPPQFDVRGVRVERSSLSYTDRGSGRTYELGDLTFNAPRVANTVQTPVNAAFTARYGDGAVLVSVKLEGRLAMDLEARRHALDGSVIEVDGRVPGMPHLSARVAGDVIARLDAGEIELSGLTCAVSGKVRDEELAMTLEAGKLVAQAGRARGETLRAAVEMKGTSGTTAFKIASPALVREGDSVRAAEAAVDIALRRGEHHFVGGLTGGLDARIVARTVAVADMRSKFHLSGPGLPRQGLAGAATGEARIDAAGEIVKVALKGTVGESKVQADLRASGFAAPVYAFNIAIEELDVDRYMTHLAEYRRKPVTSSEAANLLEPLVQLPATGTITVARLKSAGVSARNVRFDMK